MPRLERWEVHDHDLAALALMATICWATYLHTTYTLLQSASMMYCQSATDCSRMFWGLL